MRAHVIHMAAGEKQPRRGSQRECREEDNAECIHFVLGAG
jgi:hypothetical protein